MDRRPGRRGPARQRVNQGSATGCKPLVYQDEKAARPFGRAAFFFCETVTRFAYTVQRRTNDAEQFYGHRSFTQNSCKFRYCTIYVGQARLAAIGPDHSEGRLNRRYRTRHIKFPTWHFLPHVSVRTGNECFEFQEKHFIGAAGGPDPSLTQHFIASPACCTGNTPGHFLGIWRCRMS